MKPYLFIAYILPAVAFFTGCDHGQKDTARSSIVEIRKENDRFMLYRNGVPYFIKGGSGNGSLEKLKQIGGNSIRTYTTQNAQEILDEAEKLGLTVMLGIWIEPYSDDNTLTDSMFRQRTLRFIAREVERYKDHPALLMWGVGNEVHPINPNISSWKFLSEACGLVQNLDPNHPVTTSIAGYPRRNIPFMNQFLVNVDFVSFNTFGGVDYFEKRMDHPVWGYKGPYLLSEWGYYGYWSVERTRWHTPMEPYSNSKAPRFREIWDSYITKDKDCIGGYVFYWGQKQEYTRSWYSLFSSEGEKTLIVDTLAAIWNGTKTDNYPPHILSLQMDNTQDAGNVVFAPNSTHTLTVVYADHEQDSITIEAEIRHESSMRKNIYGIENEPFEIKNRAIKVNGDTIIFNAPPDEGIYRMYIKLTDGHNNCDMANVVFMVKE